MSHDARLIIGNSTPVYMKKIRYISLAVISVLICLYLKSEAYYFEEYYYYIYAYIFFVILCILPIFCTIDLFEKRKVKKYHTIIFPIVLCWIGFLIVWLFLREEGEKEYPFQKIF